MDTMITFYCADKEIVPKLIFSAIGEFIGPDVSTLRTNATPGLPRFVQQGMIVRNYLRGWMILDIASTVPVYLFGASDKVFRSDNETALA